MEKIMNNFKFKFSFFIVIILCGNFFQKLCLGGRVDNIVTTNQVGLYLFNEGQDDPSKPIDVIEHKNSGIGNLQDQGNSNWFSDSIGVLLSGKNVQTHNLISQGDLSNMAASIATNGFTIQVWMDYPETTPEGYLPLIEIGSNVDINAEFDYCQNNLYSLTIIKREQMGIYVLHSLLLDDGACIGFMTPVAVFPSTFPLLITSIYNPSTTEFTLRVLNDAGSNVAMAAAPAAPLMSSWNAQKLYLGPLHQSTVAGGIIGLKAKVFLLNIYDRPLTSLEVFQNYQASVANSAPFLLSLSQHVLEDTDFPFSLSVSDKDLLFPCNDKYPEQFTYEILSLPSKGTLTDPLANPSNITVPQNLTAFNVSYLPLLNQYNLMDPYTTFLYRVYDNFTVSKQRSVSVFVDPVNDAPVPVNATIETVVGKYLTITMNGSDVDDIDKNLPIAVVLTTPSIGNLYKIENQNQVFPNEYFYYSSNGRSLLYRSMYRPSEGNNKRILYDDSFTFAISDGEQLSPPGLIKLHVLNDLEALDETKFLLEDQSLRFKFNVNAHSPESQNYKIEILSLPTNGVLYKEFNLSMNTSAPVFESIIISKDEYVWYLPNEDVSDSNVPLDSVSFRALIGDVGAYWYSGNSTLFFRINPVNDVPILTATKKSFEMLADSNEPGETSIVLKEKPYENVDQQYYTFLRVSGGFGSFLSINEEAYLSGLITMSIGNYKSAKVMFFYASLNATNWALTNIKIEATIPGLKEINATIWDRDPLGELFSTITVQVLVKPNTDKAYSSGETLPLGSLIIAWGLILLIPLCCCAHLICGKFKDQNKGNSRNKKNDDEITLNICSDCVKAQWNSVSRVKKAKSRKEK